jgi:hypothetical protein
MHDALASPKKSKAEVGAAAGAPAEALQSVAMLGVGEQ